MNRATAKARATELGPSNSVPSLRQKLRLLGRDAILDAACELFLQNGYRSTTMQAVAEHAAVGVATVFRHFKTKEGILAALSRRDTEKIMERARAAVTPPPAHPVEAMLRVLLIVLETHGLPSTRIRGQTRLWLLLPTGHPETDEVVTSSDRELQALMLQLLQHYRRAGLIRRNLDLADMTIAIFAVFYHHYLQIGLDRSADVEQVREELARRLPLLFEPWTVAKLTTSRASAHRRSTRSKSRRA
jgi:AcrR family transcriptional regulator